MFCFQDSQHVVGNTGIEVGRGWGIYLDNSNCCTRNGCNNSDCPLCCNVVCSGCSEICNSLFTCTGNLCQSCMECGGACCKCNEEVCDFCKECGIGFLFDSILTGCGYLLGSAGHILSSVGDCLKCDCNIGAN